MPGNSKYNEGVGEYATSIAGFKWMATLVNVTDTSFTVTISSDDHMCEPSLSGRTGCCESPFKKTEFVINDGCRNQIRSVTSSGPSKPKQPSYQYQPYPGTVPPSMVDYPEPLTARIPNIQSSAGQSTEFTVTLKDYGNCPTVESFLYLNQYWYAAFGDTYKKDACCGQAIVAV